MQQIANSAKISPTAKLGPFCVIRENVSIADNVQLGVGCVLEEGAIIDAGTNLGNYVVVGANSTIGANTQVGDHCKIYPDTKLGENCFIGSNSSLGRLPRPAATSTVKVNPSLEPLTLGPGCTVGCSVTLYRGTSYGARVLVGDGAVVREGCKVGDNVVIGSGVIVENATTIGEFTKIQSGSYITAYMEIEERVFIAPMVTTTNDNYMGRTEKRFGKVKGARIMRGARIGGASILLPGITIAPETFVAAGALVTKDTTQNKVVKGFPAKELRDVPAEELLPE